MGGLVLVAVLALPFEGTWDSDGPSKGKMYLCSTGDTKGSIVYGTWLNGTGTIKGEFSTTTESPMGVLDGNWTSPSENGTFFWNLSDLSFSGTYDTASGGFGLWSASIVDFDAPTSQCGAGPPALTSASGSITIAWLLVILVAIFIAF